MVQEIMPDHMLRRAGVLPDNGPAVDRIRGAVNRASRPTPRMLTAIDNMLRKLKHHNPDVWRKASDFIDAHRETMTFDQARETIQRLIAQLDAPAAVTTTTVEPVNHREAWAEWRTLAAKLVEMGGRHGARFAVDTEDGATNLTAFWWIVPNEGPHGTRYFIRQVIGGQGAVRVRMSPEAMISIARKIIDADPKEAMLRFGREIGECGHCGRTLTNDDSRARGIGPVCARGKGW